MGQFFLRRWTWLAACFPVLVLWFQALPIAPAQAPTVQPTLPDLAFKRLLNDLQVTVASTPYLGEQMTIGLVIPYGSVFDPIDKGGLAQLTSRMFLKATLDKTAADIQADIAYLGVTLEIETDWDGMRFILKGPSERYERALLLLYQVVGEAKFNEDDFQVVRQQVIADLEKPADPRRQVHAAFETTLFGGTSYGRSSVGTLETIKRITVGDVRYFYNRYVSPESAALVVTGSAPPALVLQKAARIWGVWVRKDEVPFTFLPPRNPAVKQILLEDDPQTLAAQFILGNLWPRRNEPSHDPAVLAAQILQERLTRILPTSLVTVGYEGRRLPGPFFIQGQAAAEQAPTEIMKILEAVEEFKNNGVTAEEIDRAKALRLENYRKSLGTTSGVCRILLDAELYRLGTNYMTALPELLERVGSDTVESAASENFFPAGVLVYVRGPAAILKSELEKLGALQPNP